MSRSTLLDDCGIASFPSVRSRWVILREAVSGSDLLRSTSIQGASQAVEDGVVLATLLSLAKRRDAPLAVRAWEDIRWGHFLLFLMD